MPETNAVPPEHIRQHARSVAQQADAIASGLIPAGPMLYAKCRLLAENAETLRAWTEIYKS